MTRVKLEALVTTVLMITLGFVTSAKADNAEHVQQLLATQHCQGCDLNVASWRRSRRTLEF